MVEIFEDNKIAIGWGNTVGLTNIETIAVGGVYFPTPDTLDDYEPGDPFIDGIGITRFNGFPVVGWYMGVITLAQYWYIHDTLLVGSFSGKVTVRTRTASLSSYANYNAVLTIGVPAEIDQQPNEIFDFIWEFSLRETI